MASDSEFVQYVCDQLARAGSITSRKMLGEYAVYLDGKVIMLVCDNQVFLKDTGIGRSLLRHAAFAAPYPGAKPHLQVTDLLDDPELLVNVVRRTADALPAPKPRKPKKPKQATHPKQPKISEIPKKSKKQNP